MTLNIYHESKALECLLDVKGLLTEENTSPAASDTAGLYWDQEGCLDKYTWTHKPEIGRSMHSIA